ncbi:MAG TPA: hypothetical protein PLU35_01205 [Phycisphaerales bacterium]|nr:hypothetical protein [Phycisphaerales bacterium]
MTNRSRIIVHSLVGLPMALLAAAGVLKFADLTSFARDLDGWDAVPSALVAPVALLVPVFEVGTAALWFSGTWRAISLISGIVLITVFSAVFAYEYELAAHGPPACACFGTILRYEATRAEAWSVLIRNAGLLSALSAGAWLWFGQASRTTCITEPLPAAD